VNLNFPAVVIEWTNKNWPELAKAGGLEAVELVVVDRLRFNSQARAMVWNGVVEIRRGWIEPALADLDGQTLKARHVWALETLAFHEPVHVLEQRSTFWPFYLLRYFWHFLKFGGYRKIPEEVRAYRRQEAMTAAFLHEVGQHIPAQLTHRPEKENAT
jgi:hypothetical protein